VVNKTPFMIHGIIKILVITTIGDKNLFSEIESIIKKIEWYGFNLEACTCLDIEKKLDSLNPDIVICCTNALEANTALIKTVIEKRPNCWFAAISPSEQGLKFAERCGAKPLLFLTSGSNLQNQLLKLVGYHIDSEDDLGTLAGFEKN
jgi:hypothetical protein